MIDLLDSATTWLDAIRQTHMSQTVQYKRGEETISVIATLGATTFEVADEGGLIVQAKSTDFLISASALVLSEGLVKPKIRDQIIRTVDGEDFTFEVLDLGSGGHYRPTDAYGKILRIHTKQIGGA